MENFVRSILLMNVYLWKKKILGKFFFEVYCILFNIYYKMYVYKDLMYCMNNFMVCCW